MNYAKAKIVALFLVILLVGLWGGFVISYLIYQPQISSLTSEVATIRTELNESENQLDSLKAIISNSTGKLQTPNITNIESQIEELQVKFEILRKALLNLTEIMEDFNHILNILLTIQAMSGSERLDFLTTDTTSNSAEFIINITVKNVGSSPAIITAFFLNGTLYNNISGVSISPNPSTNILAISANAQQTFIIRMPINLKIGDATAASGATLDITIQTLTGNRYTKTVNLP
ncbi:MAG: hypothetical protein QXQ41_02000 [Candidatus Bathyarchaeia archaeon]